MDKIITKRLILTLADISNLNELELIEKECIDYFSFDPPCENNHTCTIKECLTIGDIPKGGKKENYYFYCIRKNNLLIGFLDFYLEYQRKETAYISSLYIKETHRRNNFGKEIIEAVENKFISLDIKEIRLHVSLRNATALYFWAKQGVKYPRLCRGYLTIKNVKFTEKMIDKNGIP